LDAKAEGYGFPPYSAALAASGRTGAAHPAAVRRGRRAAG